MDLNNISLMTKHQNLICLFGADTGSNGMKWNKASKKVAKRQPAGDAEQVKAESRRQKKGVC